jgi:hypothetical protein
VVFLSRGAITLRKLFHKDGFIYGKPLIDAYKIERHKSIYPRVLISPEALEFIRSNYCPIIFPNDQLNHLIIKDIDNEFYINSPHYYPQPIPIRAKQIHRDQSFYSKKNHEQLLALLRYHAEKLVDSPTKKEKWDWLIHKTSKVISQPINFDIYWAAYNFTKLGYELFWDDPDLE